MQRIPGGSWRYGAIGSRHCFPPPLSR
jgi:hypothetical protein